MINRVVLVGRLTRDPEFRKTPNGASTVSYTLACQRRIRTPGQPEADFINCVAWNKTADTMAQYLHKGSLIGVEGRIQTRSYDNQQGGKVYVTEVITESFAFLESKEGTRQNSTQNNYNSPVQNTTYHQQSNGEVFGRDYDDGPLEIASDDLPF